MVSPRKSRKLRTAGNSPRRDGNTAWKIAGRGAQPGKASTSEGGKAMEHQETYLQTVFGFLGVTDIRFVRAEGIAMGAAPKAQAIEAAELAIKSLTATPANQPSVALAA